MSDELLARETDDDWHAWLAARNANTPDGVWLEFAKQGAAHPRDVRAGGRGDAREAERSLGRG